MTTEHNQKDYDYYILPREIIPPIGRNKYAATVVDFYEISTGTNIKIAQSFPESWGVTAEDAIEKMEAKVQTWIEQDR